MAARPTVAIPIRPTVFLPFEDGPAARGYGTAAAVLGSVVALLLLCCGGLAAVTGLFGPGDRNARPPAVEQDRRRPG